MSQTVFSKSPFNALPTFPEHEGEGYTAIVTGANGITGAHIVRVLSESPRRWGKIHALSRRASSDALPSQVEHLSIDFLASPEDISSKLSREIDHVDYVFFASYLQPPPKPGQSLWSDHAETERVNMALLTNFLTALSQSKLLPKRLLLQTGAKHYGVHLGPPLTPMEESDPRFLREPNFYFLQEDFVWKWCADNGVDWNVTRPGFIIGAVKEAAMNIAYGLALYASVQSHLGQALKFPGDIAAWEVEKHLSSAILIAYHAEWAVLSPQAANQVLNISDGGVFTYEKFWPILAKLYGTEYGHPEEEESKYVTITLPTTPPPRGFGPPGIVKANFSFEEWATRPEVQEAWKALKEKYELVAKPDPFLDPKDVFGLIDGEISGPWARSIDMAKSRKLGWHGFVDSKDGLIMTFEELEKLKMVPPMVEVENLDVKYHGY